MSASTQRKNRQAEIEAGTYRKQTAQKERDEKRAKEKRTITLCIAFVALLVVAAILLNAIPAARRAREARVYTEGNAVTVGDRVYSPAEVGYLYTNMYSNYSSDYSSMIYGLDTSSGPVGLSAQDYHGPQTEGKTLNTWRDVLLDAVHSQLIQTQALLKYAADNGITLSEEEKTNARQNLPDYASYASRYGYPNVDQFLADNLATGLTLDTVLALNEDMALASKALDAYLDGQEYSDEQIREAYDAFHGLYDSYSYAAYQIPAQAAEGETPTEQALAEAEAEADAIIASYKDADDVDDPFERLNGYIEEELGDSASRADNVQGSNISSLFLEWLSMDRQVGDIEKISDDTNYYVVLFLGHEDAFYPTVNVRHILIQPESAEDGSVTEEARAAAKAEAERILAEFEAGDKSEESFAALAEQYSSDTGSNTNGGLYENVYKGQMVQAFNDFCFGDRKSGDVGVVETDYGFHVIYFVGEGDIYGEILAKNSLRSQSFSDFIEASGLTAVAGPDEALVDPVTAQPAAEAETPAEEVPAGEAPAEETPADK